MRQLLALVALLTGLAALSEPVRAAEAGVESVSMAEAPACHVQAVQAAVPLVVKPSSDCADGLVEPLRTPSLNIPAVILQADRARE